MILVVCGTHHQPFDRLVHIAAELARRGEEVVVQRGASRVEVPGAEVHDLLPPDQLEALADRAEAIVAHAGPGSLFLAWDRGLCPVVVARRAALGEHVDDHQERFAATLGDRARTASSAEDVILALKGVRGVVDPRRRPDGAVGAAFAARFSELAEKVVSGGHRPSGALVRLRLLLCPGSRGS